MKNILLIVVLLLSVNNLTQADMLGSTKDSTVNVDSTEVETLCFSNAEIAKIIEDSRSLNPQIQNLSIIKTTDTVVLKINDSSLYTFSPSRGEYCWIVLERGIKKNKLIPIFSIDDSTSFSSERQLDSITVSNFLREVDYYLENRNSPPDSFSSFKESALVDSNSSEKESLVLTESNIPKKTTAVQPRKMKKISPAEKIEKEKLSKELLGKLAPIDRGKEYDDALTLDSFQKNDGDILSDSLSVMKRTEHVYNYGSDESNSIKISVKELICAVAGILIFIFALVYGLKDYKKNRPFSNKDYLKELRKDQKLERERIKRGEHFLKE